VSDDIREPTPHRLGRLREKAQALMLDWEHSGRELKGDRVRELAHRLARGLSAKEHPVNPRMVEVVLDRMSGKALTTPRARSMATTVAGVWHLLEAGKVPARWNGRSPVPSTVQVTDMERSPKGRGRWECGLTVVLGQLAGAELRPAIGHRYAIGLLGRVVGWHDDNVPEDLAGTMFDCVLAPCHGGLAMTDAQTTAAQRNANRKLRKSRRERCALERYDAVCFDCPLPTSECDLSRHSARHRVGWCRSVVTRHRGWLTPSGWCRKCLERGLCDEREQERKGFDDEQRS
jgi:hypothetical protein